MMPFSEKNWILFARPEKCFVYHRKSFQNVVIFVGNRPECAYDSTSESVQAQVTELEAPNESSAFEIRNKIQDVLDSLKIHPRGIKFKVHWHQINGKFDLIVKELDSWPVQDELALES